MGPYLTRRVAQAAWELSASVCSSSAVACVVCKPLGRVSLDAHVDEQRRIKAEARVPFLLVTYSLGKQRKVTRQGAKRNGKRMKNANLTSSSVPPYSSKVTQLCINLAWILACARMTTFFNLEQLSLAPKRHPKQQQLIVKNPYLMWQLSPKLVTLKPSGTW